MLVKIFAKFFYEMELSSSLARYHVPLPDAQEKKGMAGYKVAFPVIYKEKLLGFFLLSLSLSPSSSPNQYKN